MNRARFHLAPEWAVQHSILICWPHQDTDWHPWLESLDSLYLTLAGHILQHEHLLIICRDEPHRQHIQRLFLNHGLSLEQVKMTALPYDDTWVRDYAPLSLLDDRGQTQLKSFRFNGWGGKYPAGKDDTVSRRLAELGRFGDVSLEFIEFTLEGGALETDGKGTLLATRRSVIDERRNPGMCQEQVENLLIRELGIDRFLWLSHGGLSGDDTDGHIDTLVRFADADTLLYVTALPEDPDYPGLKRMEQDLSTFRTPAGKPYRLVPLPAPAPIHDSDDQRLPASYANFLIINDAVLAPTYADPADDLACHCLESCFPNRHIIPIDCRPLIRQNGSLHCATMQLL